MDHHLITSQLSMDVWPGLERLRDLPGIANPDIIDYFIAGTKDLPAHHDPEYIFRYRRFYLNQLEYLATLI